VMEVDHVTVYRWVQTFTSEFIDSARPARQTTSDRCFVDETYLKVARRWTAAATTNSPPNGPTPHRLRGAFAELEQRL
jgi:hypothetical protein